MSKYQSNSIKTLDYFDHIRKYPGMYLGSKDEKALLHCVKEILSNSIDEYLNGAGNTITITLLPSDGIKIEDNARGIPHGKHSSGCSILQACLGIANTGGKFDNVTGQSGYNSSGGEHGTGCKAVNAVSSKLTAISYREGIKEIVEFSKGKFIKHEQMEIPLNVTGTSIEFYPDPEVLEVTKFNYEAIRTMVREFSYLCKGLTFILVKDGVSETYCSKNGLLDYLEYLSPKLITKPIYFEQKEGKYQVEVAVAYSSTYSSSVRLYTNNIPQNKGTHLTGFKSAWTAGLNNFARENKLLKDKDENLSGTDYEEGLVLILNFKMIDPVFKGQSKEELTSSEGRTYVQKLTTKALENIFVENKNDLKKIIDKAIKAKKAREAARKAREAVRDKDKKNKVLKFASKLADCSSKKREECELYIVEGK